MAPFTIRPVSSSPAQIIMLCNLLIETVASGGSVSFMHPLELQEADAFWSAALNSATQGERTILGAFDGDRLAGTVSLVLVQTPNQPHRAEISKLMTSVDYRGQGVATLLMQAAETLAREHGRTHLMLDTASDSNAVSLYEKLGFQRAGEIPDFALNPFGELTSTIFFWKSLQ
ncbi:GNAT family N-acetyltransferase [Pseudochrobactrum kiredjianiae]|uniref:GNAT family N-acetyltransferase n=1 Tax=Pseudochrobactrum kiredjianiae TaxID=386305 RepID=A0ABW3V312_9HYPH